MTAEELVERYEGWLEAAETGDFTDVDFTGYEGNTLPSPVMQLSVYEEEGDVKMDEDVVRAYMIETGDIGYRNLQKLAKGTSINPIGKETSDLLDDVRNHYGSTQDMLEEINEREEEFEDFKFETIVRDRLLEEEIHGRDRIRTMLSEFKDESNYGESENPEPRPEPDPGPEPEPVPNGGENHGGENLMTDNEEIREGLVDRRYELIVTGDEAPRLKDNVRNVSAEMGEVLSELQEADDEMEGLRNLFGDVVEHDAEAYGQLADLISNSADRLGYEVKAARHLRDMYEGTDQQMDLSRLEHVQSASRTVTDMWPDSDYEQT